MKWKPGNDNETLFTLQSGQKVEVLQLAPITVAGKEWVKIQEVNLPFRGGWVSRTALAGEFVENRPESPPVDTPRNPNQRTSSPQREFINRLPLDVTHLQKGRGVSGSCSQDYSKYHTIVQLADTVPSGATLVEETKKILSRSVKTGAVVQLAVYEVIVSGVDPVAGETRRIRISFRGDLFTGETSTGQTGFSFGSPGTRITFDGDKWTPFSPVPELAVWDGAIDIDPDCGVVISPGTQGGWGYVAAGE